MSSHIHASEQYVYRLILDIYILESLLIVKRTIEIDLCNLKMWQIKKWVRKNSFLDFLISGDVAFWFLKMSENVDDNSLLGRANVLIKIA